MNTYIVLIVLILLFRLLKGNNPYWDRFTKAAFIALFVVYGFRNATLIGADSATSYYYGFMKSGIFEIKDFNFAFDLINFIFYHIPGHSYQLFITVISAFVSVSFYRLVRNYSPNPFISIMWYMGMLFYIFMFSALKQSIAMAILCYAFDAIIRENRKKFVILVIIASLFHFPALIFLPAYWIRKMGISRNYLILLGSLLLIVFLFRENILNLMTIAYGGESNSYSGIEAKFLGVKNIIMIVMIVIAIIVRPSNTEDRVYTSVLSFMGIAAVLQTFCYYNNTFERLADYYYVFSILFVPMIFDGGVNRNGDRNMQGETVIASVANCVITAFSIWRFLAYINTNALLFLPYRFFWQ